MLLVSNLTTLLLLPNGYETLTQNDLAPSPQILLLESHSVYSVESVPMLQQCPPIEGWFQAVDATIIDVFIIIRHRGHLG